jgi:hypothetical protein
MVGLMETHPTIAITGSYQLRGNKVQWKGLSPNREIFPGRGVCRIVLTQEIPIFGPPTSCLYRSELIRNTKQFFPITDPDADTCAFYEYLQHYDFGFVHEILSIEREHDDRVSTRAAELNVSAASPVEYVLKYGPIYLSEAEFETISKRSLDRYYSRLGGSVLKLKSREFWRYHVSRMRELGAPISWRKVARAVFNEILEEMRSPRVGLYKLLQVVRQKYFEVTKSDR